MYRSPSTAMGRADEGWRLTFEGQASENGSAPVTLDGALALAQSDRAGCAPAAAAPATPRHGGAQAKAHGELRAFASTRSRSRASEADGAQTDRARRARPRRRSEAHARSCGAAPRARSARRGERPGSKIVGASGSLADRPRALKALAGGVTASLPSRAQRRFNFGAETVELADESFGNLQLERHGDRERSVDLVLERQLDRARRDRLLGRVRRARGKALARGHIEVKAPDAAAFLQGLGLASEAANARIPLDARGRAEARPGRARIDALDLTLAGSRITGRLDRRRARSTAGRPASRRSSRAAISTSTAGRSAR